jgi:aminocarboxymuconate-semialdehyde decarboxylase
MAPVDACHRQVVIDGKNYRTVSDKCWSTSRRLADFADMGLALQAISPMPELLSYWLKAADAAVLVRYLNEQIAAMVTESGGQLIGLGAVPLQDIDLAIKELDYLRQTPGFAGVEIGSNINGMVIGDLRLDPFFEACEALDMAVFVHALRPTGMDRLIGPAPLQQVLAYPTDVGLAAASVLTSNLILRRPRSHERVSSAARISAAVAHSASAKIFLRHLGLRRNHAQASAALLRRQPTDDRHRLPVQLSR